MTGNPERSAEIIVRIIARAIERALTAELPRAARSRVLDEPRITLTERPELPGVFTVSAAFTLEYRPV